ncbi:AraC family transcriptional regulator [Maricurvus nonylphenolicus]|uniref:AraC family transcriptional regulator n=1 Tax=Maricurvus nonylphenolicus TaxID=1008307 RepID=UPI0036F1E63D
MMIRTSPLSDIEWMYTALEKYGLKPDILDELLPQYRVKSNSHLVSFENYLILLNKLSDITNDPLLGIHITESLPLEVLGLFGYLVKNARTLRELCQNAERYWSTLTQASVIEYQENERNSSLIYRLLLSTDVSAQHEVESTLTGLVVLFRERIGTSWTPEETHFQHPMKGPLKNYQKIFGKNIHFEMPVNQIFFDSSILDIQYAHADLHLLSILRENAESLLHNIINEENFVSSVRLMIMSQLAQGDADIINVSKKLNMSSRKLQKMLKDNQTSFREIRDNLRIELAKQALLETDSPIALIAQNLGFSESASFNHSFRRMTGVSPRQYKKSHLK